MRIFFALFFTCTGMNCFAQELRVMMDYGFATGEMKDAKRIMLQNGFRVGGAFSIGERTWLSIMAGSSVLRFNHTSMTGEQVFNRKFFLTLPATIKRYYPFSGRSSGFIEAGIYGSLLLLDSKETWNGIGTSISSFRNTGKNAGAVLILGFKTMITQRLYFEVSMVGLKDFFAEYKQDQHRILTEKTSLGISFSRKI